MDTSVPSKLDQRHLDCIRMLLEGIPRNKIAEMLGVHPTLIWQWQQRPEFQTELERVRGELQRTVGELIKGRLAEEAPKSLEKIVKLRDDASSQRLQAAMAQDLLDRAGFKAVERVQQLHAHVLSPEFAEFIRVVLKEEREIATGGTAALPAAEV